MKQPCVYILASQILGTIYIGVTSDMIGRLYQHRTDQVKGFTSKYEVHRLVRFEQYWPLVKPSAPLRLQRIVAV